ncbi:MAG: TerB family tellurite resistance protein [Myxococcota bacterium]
MEIRDLLEPTESALIALCALLLELAHIDGEFSEPEVLLLIDLFSKEMAQSIVKGEALIARAQARLHAVTDLRVLTEELRTSFDEDERAALVGLLWQVAWADGRLDRFEGYLIGRLGGLLDVPEERMREEHRHALERLRG